MKTKQQGFTLIELVVVIVLLGIIGAVATARFQDLSTNAGNAAAQGVAAEISSGSAINYAASQLGTAQVAISGTVDCTATGANTVRALLQAGDVQCSVSHANGDTSATATVICTG
jgi:prepilin-type N-terminal cleavage/methylation domain-containing protein